MKKIILLCLLTFTSSIFGNETGSSPVLILGGPNGTQLTMVKQCLRHNVIYESHPYVDGGSYPPCSFPLRDRPGMLHRHVPHDPECFSEREVPVPIQ